MAPLVLTAALAASGCAGALVPPEPGSGSPSVARDPALSAYYDQKVTWEPCEHAFECATVRVPLAYGTPGGDQISLSVVRLRAGDPARKIGSLFVNPGGPGASGVDYARSARGAIGDDVLERYDLIGFDPRGVGSSTPITCLSGPQTDRMLAVVGQPDSSAAAGEVAAEAKSFGNACASKSPALTPNIGSIPAARDMDILRALVGDEKLNYLGRSYGTFLGLTYAGLFPERVGRWVLDGAMSSTLTLADLARGQAEGFQLALGRFASDCQRRKKCPLPSGTAAADPAPGIGAINRWLDRLAARPLTASGRQLTRSLAVTAMVGSLYEPSSGWPGLRAALAAGFRGNAGPLLEIVDQFTGRQPDGTYASNAVDALYAVNCLDHDDRAGAVATEAAASEWALSAPTFGAYFAWGNLPCATWPAPATDGPHAVSAPGSGPILVVGTRYDPATPYAWSEQAASMLSNAALLTWEGDGHTAYHRGSECVDRIADGFFLSGILPKAPATC